MEQLRAYLQRHKLSPETLGELIGCGKWTIRKLLFPPGHRCHRRPSDKLKRRIAEATGGEVPVSAWYAEEAFAAAEKADGAVRGGAESAEQEKADPISASSAAPREAPGERAARIARLTRRAKKSRRSSARVRAAWAEANRP